MGHHKIKQTEKATRITRFVHRFKAFKSHYGSLKTLLLMIGFAMIALSISPVPFGNASQKSPFVTLEIQPDNLQPDVHSQESASAQLALSTQLNRLVQADRIQPEPDSTAAQETERPAVRTATVLEGDSLSVIFQRLQLPQSVLHNVLDAGDDAKQLKHLRPGQMLEFEITEDQTVEKVRHRLSDVTVLEVALDEDSQSYRARVITEDLERRIEFATGTINRALFLSGQRAGLSDKVIMQLVGIFAWDVDFALDVRSGDRFALIYEQFYKEGEKIKDGNILAAEFVNRERVFRAVQYENDKGETSYYTPDGHNMRKRFLRTPVAFTRISSRFQLRRWHPVLHKFRAHRGVDYAAPRGTPVKVTASGKITFVGRKGGLGKAIFVRHGKKYTTVYGHLNKYAKGIKRGRSVRQGQLIGYVGSTGLATGPHLHYEFRVNGVHKDPLTVELPKAESIDGRYRFDFKRKTEKLITQLGVLSRTMLATQPGTSKGKS
uniref:Murein DD-endopeptidase MepM and murein hydrolase activator NlpD, contain LysM domain n=1 Tax=Candidatus Kentrum sp. FM TaxID=2126340 RepID=A0A450T6X6_9GAMM|nr:MAG: Murein DD-endopeptidase MepM and murein hydrolase activator NlpD, contain LysM domain [Candidatus Kentron sp. FM]VFJ62463.1 MAG: Murein DD-endopeptidase MepM and murein hydrolase activator NlpD, contain LysM domain [Candidatus Kentron sp. FM]VFK14224.1 MAG: Murein DD-endopeptidase MepM and murein hydrolase activator NlpD, contain LysM domain [Candidatus Kentron sp. FM]